MGKKIKIFIIGSNSFSGASFCAYALENGAQVCGVSRSLEPNSVFLPYSWTKYSKNFQFYQFDINYDMDKILAEILSFEPDYIVNYAAQSMVAQSWDQPGDWFRTNTLSTVLFHDRLRRDYKKLKKYVHVTTPEVYGSSQEWLNEGASLNPSTPYAVSRAAADMSLKTFYDAYGFPVVLTRAANVYGPGQQLYRIIPKTILAILQGKSLELHGGGKSERSFIYVDDVSSATWAVMIHDAVGETFHISTKETISIRGLVSKICKLMQVDFDDHVESSEDRLGRTSKCANSTKLGDNKLVRDDIAGPWY